MRTRSSLRLPLRAPAIPPPEPAGALELRGPPPFAPPTGVGARGRPGPPLAPSAERCARGMEEDAEPRAAMPPLAALALPVLLLMPRSARSFMPMEKGGPR